MGDYIADLRKLARKARTPKHILLRKEYSAETRTAFFSSISASVVFWNKVNTDVTRSESFDAANDFLNSIGIGLLISDAEQNDLLNTLSEVPEADMSKQLQEFLSYLSDEFLKYAFLTDLRRCFLTKGNLTKQETEYLKMLADILFMSDTDFQWLWDRNPTSSDLDRILKETVQEKTILPGSCGSGYGLDLI